MDLEECYHLRSFGPTALLSKCKATPVTYTSGEDSCGPQPVFGNWAIANDGRALRPVTTCFWEDNHINFEGIQYEFRDGAWIRINSTAAVKLTHFNAHVNITVDRFGVEFPNDGDTATPLVFEMLGELQGMVADTGSHTFNSFVEVTKDVVRLTWLERFQQSTWELLYWLVSQFLPHSGLDGKFVDGARCI